MHQVFDPRASLNGTIRCSFSVQSDDVPMSPILTEDPQRLWIKQTDPAAGMLSSERKSLQLRAYRSLVNSVQARCVVRWRDQKKKKASVNDSLTQSTHCSRLMHGIVIEALEGPKKPSLYHELITKENRQAQTSPFDCEKSPSAPNYIRLEDLQVTHTGWREFTAQRRNTTFSRNPTKSRLLHSHTTTLIPNGIL